MDSAPPDLKSALLVLGAGLASLSAQVRELEVRVRELEAYEPRLGNGLPGDVQMILEARSCDCGFSHLPSGPMHRRGCPMGPKP